MTRDDYSGMTKFYYLDIFVLLLALQLKHRLLLYSGVPLSCSYNQMPLLPVVDEAVTTTDAVCRPPVSARWTPGVPWLGTGFEFSSVNLLGTGLL